MKNLKVIARVIMLAAIVFVSAPISYAADINEEIQLPPPAAEGSLNQKLIQIPVSDVVVEGADFKSGDVIAGTFVVLNASDVPIENLRYVISLVNHTEDKIPNLKIEPRSSTLPGVLSPGEQVTVPFSYTVPSAIPPIAMAIDIVTVNEDNIMLGWDESGPLTIVGDVEPVVLSRLSVDTSDGETYDPSEGPIVYRDIEPTSAKLSVEVTSNSDTARRVIPRIVIFEKNNPGVAVYDQSAEAQELAIQGTGKFSVDLPNFEYNAGVYFGTVQFFDDKNTSVSSLTNFQYIVAGKIVTIQGVTADKQMVEKGDTVALSVQYIGAPFDLNDPSKVVSQDQNAQVHISLFNEDNKEIATYDGVHDFNSTQQEAVFNLEADRDAEALRATISVSDGDKILSSFEAILSPSYEEAAAEEFSVVYYILIATLVVIIGVVAFVYRAGSGQNGSSGKSGNVVASIAALLLIAGGVFLTYGVNNGSVGAAYNDNIVWPSTMNSYGGLEDWWAPQAMQDSTNDNNRSNHRWCPQGQQVGVGMTTPYHTQKVEAGKPFDVKGMSWWSACYNATSENTLILQIDRKNGIPSAGDSGLATNGYVNVYNDYAGYQFIDRQSASHSWYSVYPPNQGLVYHKAPTLTQPGYHFVTVYSKMRAERCYYVARTRVMVLVLPGTPTNLSVSASGQCSADVSLEWDAAVGATSYNIYRAEVAGSAGATGSYKQIGSSNITSYTDTTAGTSRYHYKIAAVYQDATGLSLESKHSESASAPDMPASCSYDPGFSCSVTPTNGTHETVFGWSITPSANFRSDFGPVTYTWGGSDQLAGTGSSITKKYSTNGLKTASVNVTYTNEDGSQGTKIVTCPVGVTVNDDAPACGIANGTTQISPPSTNLCSNAIASAVLTNDAGHQWTCSANNQTASCAASRCPAGQMVVNGVCAPVTQDLPPQCGSANGVMTEAAPTQNLCAPNAGTPAYVSSGNDMTKHLWSCSTPGQPTANCSAPRPVCPAGQVMCGSSCSSTCNNLPSCGTAENVPTDNAPTSGLCSNSVGTTPILNTTTGKYRWTCVSGSTQVSCLAPKTCNGGPCTGGPTSLCGSSAGVPKATAPINNLCSGATAGNVVYNSTTKDYEWMCTSGTSSSICKAPKIICTGSSCGGGGTGTFIEQFYLDPSVVPKDTDKCKAMWNIYGQAATVPAVTCTLNSTALPGGSVSVGTSGVGRSVTPGTYTLTCTDGVTTDSVEKVCKVLPDFNEF